MSSLEIAAWFVFALLVVAGFMVLRIVIAVEREEREADFKKRYESSGPDERRRMVEARK